MFRYLLKRILLAAFSIFLLIVITYFLIGLLKGNPLNPANYKTKADYDRQVHAYGLDKALIIRFWDYFTGIFHWNFGYVYNASVMGDTNIPRLFFKPLKYTLIITGSAFIISSIAGIIFGIFTGYNNGKWVDVVITFVIIFFLAVPAFIIAAFFLILGPMLGLPTTFLNWSVYGFGDFISSIILPVLVLTIANIANITYYLRNEIIVILSSDYIMNARSKGLSEGQIFRKYVWRNSLIPMLTILIPNFVYLMVGSIVIERFFGVPGTSSVIANAAKVYEVNVVMFNTLFFGTLTIFSYILLDVLYVLIDPRIKFATAGSNTKFGIKAWFKRKSNARKGVLHA